MTEETIEHVTGVIGAKGSDAWYQMPVEELLPESMRDQADKLDKGQDTMDVWWAPFQCPICLSSPSLSLPLSQLPFVSLAFPLSLCLSPHSARHHKPGPSIPSFGRQGRTRLLVAELLL